MDQEITYRLDGLTKFDKLELEEDSNFRFQESPVPEGTHGEAVTFTVIVAMAGISTLAAFLLRKHQGESFEEVIEEIYPDGKIKRKVVRWSKNSAEAPESSVIKQIQGGIL